MDRIKENGNLKLPFYPCILSIFVFILFILIMGMFVFIILSLMKYNFLKH
jgi:hypothetical protein